MNTQIKVGIFGFGYCATFLTHELDPNRFQILATSRTPDKLIEKHHHLKFYDFSLTSANHILSQCQFILITIPPNKDGDDPVLEHFKAHILTFKENLRWVGYLSSTGVYGDHQGQWVNEMSECINPGSSGKKRLTVEKAWLSLYETYQLPVHIFRLAGIYGPGRSSIDKILANKKVSYYKPDQVFSRIHVEDIARALILSINQPTPGEIFNLSDDCPAAPHEVDAFAAKLLGKKAPALIPYEQAGLSPLGQEFFKSCKRVSNQKIKNQLGLRLKYPDYRTGLKAIMKAFSAN